VKNRRKQGWWSRLNINGSGSGANFSKLLSSDSGAGHFSFMSPTPAPFDLNFAGSAPALLQTKICYKLLFFVHRKNICITAKSKKISSLAFRLQLRLHSNFFLNALASEEKIKWLRIQLRLPLQLPSPGRNSAEEAKTYICCLLLLCYFSK